MELTRRARSSRQLAVCLAAACFAAIMEPGAADAFNADRCIGDPTVKAEATRSGAALPEDRIGTLRLNFTGVGSASALLRQSALVVQAHPVGAASSHPTGQHAGADGRKVLHYVQRLHVINTLKGRPPAELRLVLPGVQPLPPAKHPLNMSYPGPLADDEAYVLFLQPTGLAGLYTVVGGWQGIYPLSDEGRTVALAGAGFPQFGGLTPEELRDRLRTATQRP